jgi:hypothetical protein
MSPTLPIGTRSIEPDEQSLSLSLSVVIVIGEALQIGLRENSGRYDNLDNDNDNDNDNGAENIS